jgi:hypothetical protein
MIEQMAKAFILGLTLSTCACLATGCGGRSAAYEAGRKECADPVSVAVIKPFLSEGHRAAAAHLLKMKSDLQRTTHTPVTYKAGTTEGNDWVDGCVAALDE